MIFATKTNLLRARDGHEHARVTNIELFFDLVFVFAVTQLSHGFLEHLTLAGALQTGLLLVAVWWCWINTSWITNWLNPDKTPVRFLLFALMLAGLVMSASIPEAFGETGFYFAFAYAFMQVGRSIFMLYALHGHSAANYRNFERITIWFLVSACFALLGGLSEGETRLAFWFVGFLIEFSAPAAYFWVPGMGRSSTTDWDVDGAHMAERGGLFVIIALGESILVTGASFAQLERSPEIIAAFLQAFVGSVAMWWIYFDTGAERAGAKIAASSDPGRIARLAYTYIPMPIVAGIIVCAVSDELALHHPHGHTEIATAAVMVGGPALYLIGNLLFKHVTVGRPPLSHMAGLALLGILAVFALSLSPLMLASAATTIFVIVAIWETVSLRRVITRASK